jgi:ATP-binding cassette subfamily B protein
MFGMMLLAAEQVLQNELKIGDLVAINAFAVLVFIPLNQLGGIYREMKRCFTDVERMFDILNTQPSIKNKPNSVPLKYIVGRIEFNHVTFSYDGKRKILDDVSFTIEPKQTVALVGPSGAGKSTVARLLFRFYDINAGSIKIEGQDIADLELSSLRQAFGIVPQDATLFNSSLYENIQYGNIGASKSQVLQAASLASLDDLIQRLPDGLETVVGERGLKLSGGEKQRVAIARAILKRPAFLIFDEATSSLDSVSEIAIMKAINDVSEGHTTIIIAHRLSTIANADNIIVIDNGRVVESGNHFQLLDNNGTYRQLWDTQQEETNAKEKPAVYHG